MDNCHSENPSHEGFFSFFSSFSDKWPQSVSWLCCNFLGIWRRERWRTNTVGSGVLTAVASIASSSSPVWCLGRRVSVSDSSLLEFLSAPGGSNPTSEIIVFIVLLPSKHQNVFTVIVLNTKRRKKEGMNLTWFYFQRKAFCVILSALKMVLELWTHHSLLPMHRTSLGEPTGFFRWLKWRLRTVKTHCLLIVSTRPLRISNPVSIALECLVEIFFCIYNVLFFVCFFIVYSLVAHL